MELEEQFWGLDIFMYFFILYIYKRSGIQNKKFGTNEGKSQNYWLDLNRIWDDPDQGT